MKRFGISAVFIGMSIAALNVHAAEVNLTWGNMDEYTDVRPGLETKENYYERVQSGILRSFKRATRDLPVGYKLNVTVKDLDLAGEVIPSYRNGNEVRSLSRVTWPRMKFDFELANEKGEIVAKGEENLSDMFYLDRMKRAGLNHEFRFEEELLRDWASAQYFHKVFPKNERVATIESK